MQREIHGEIGHGLGKYRSKRGAHGIAITTVLPLIALEKCRAISWMQSLLEMKAQLHPPAKACFGRER